MFYTLPTMYYLNTEFIQKKIDEEERIRRKAKKEIDRVKLNQSKRIPIVNKKLYHKNMFR